jgi:hypothetical protein
LEEEGIFLVLGSSTFYLETHSASTDSKGRTVVVEVFGDIDDIGNLSEAKETLRIVATFCRKHSVDISNLRLEQLASQLSYHVKKKSEAGFFG